MTELLAILGALLALEIAFAGSLLAWWSLLPASVERARLRVDRTPWQCFWLGCLTAAILLPLVATLLALPLTAARIAGCFVLLTLVAFAGLGALGLAARIGRRRSRESDEGTVLTGVFVRRSLAVELAAGVWMGGAATVIMLPAAIVLMDLPLRLAWPTAWSLAFMALAVLGTALLTGRHGSRAQRAMPGTFLRGGVVLELAAGLPVVGWFLVLPAAFLTSLGAAVFALLRWMPKAAAADARAASGVKRTAVPTLVLIWLLPLIAISVAAVAFFVRGGIALELAAELPFSIWLAIILVWIVAVAGGTVLAFKRWGRWWKRPLTSGGRE
jgi:hypothetical protein